jgi:hypothetical protein
LRRLLADELQLLIGRRQPVHLWQDVAAIPHGTDWLKEIHKALRVSSFFIPIITPAFLESEMCCQEVFRFHQREQELGRDDLIFPFRYVDTSDFGPSEAHDPAVLALLQSRQWIDFVPLRHRPPDSEEVAIKLAGLAGSIRTALRRPPAPEPPLKSPESPPQQPTIQAPMPPNPWLTRPSSPPPKLPESVSTTTVAAADAVKRGLVAEEREDFDEALRWYRMAADRGNPDAQYKIGGLYSMGRGVTRDDGEAVRWFRKAADQGNTAASFSIGQNYEIGIGVTRDYAEAMRWYRKAAEQGDVMAQTQIAFMFENGIGVEKDLSEARVWMQRAADGGDDEAKKWLAKH